LFGKERDEYCCPHVQQGIYCSTTGVRKIGKSGANIHRPGAYDITQQFEQKKLQTPVCNSNGNWQAHCFVTVYSWRKVSIVFKTFMSQNTQAMTNYSLLRVLYNSTKNLQTTIKVKKAIAYFLMSCCH